jgi:hypothetical protein
LEPDWKRNCFGVKHGSGRCKPLQLSRSRIFSSFTRPSSNRQTISQYIISSQTTTCHSGGLWFG